MLRLDPVVGIDHCLPRDFHGEEVHRQPPSEPMEPCDTGDVPDWDYLKYALAVARCRSISGAAKKLKVDHTTVGRKLSALEDELSTTLFVREARLLRPTDAGEVVVAAAERMEAAMLELERALACHGETPSGIVRVATSEAFASVLVGGLPGLREAQPELRVEVLAQNRLVDVATGEADLAVRFRKTEQPSLVSKKIMELHWALYASEDYLARHGRPGSIDALSDHSFVGFEERLSESPGARWVARVATSEQIAMRGDSLLAVRSAAVAGLGLAAIPVLVANNQPALVRVFDEPVGKGGCWLVVHADLRKAPRVRAVMDYVASYLREHAAELGGVPRGVGKSAH